MIAHPFTAIVAPSPLVVHTIFPLAQFLFTSSASPFILVSLSSQRKKDIASEPRLQDDWTLRSLQENLRPSHGAACGAIRRVLFEKMSDVAKTRASGSRSPQ